MWLLVKELKELIVLETTQEHSDPDLTEVCNQLVDDLGMTYGEENVRVKKIYGSYDIVEYQINVVFPSGYTDEERAHVQDVRKALAAYMKMVIGTSPVDASLTGNRVKILICGDLTANIYAYERTYAGNPSLRIHLRSTRTHVKEAITLRESTTDDDFRTLCEEIRGMLIDELGEENVQDIGPQDHSTMQVKHMFLGSDVGRSRQAIKFVSDLIKNTAFTVTGVQPTDIPQTTMMNLFEVPGARVLVNVFDYSTLFIKIVPFRTSS